MLLITLDPVVTVSLNLVTLTMSILGKRADTVSVLLVALDPIVAVSANEELVAGLDGGRGGGDGADSKQGDEFKELHSV